MRTNARRRGRKRYVQFIGADGDAAKQTHVVNYSSNTSHTHINDGSNPYYYGDDYFYWGSDWIWCLVLGAIFFFFLLFLLLFLPYNGCYYGNRCYYYNGTHYHTIEATGEEEGEEEEIPLHPIPKFRAPYSDSVLVEQKIKEKRIERRVNSILEEKQRSCPKGMHAWMPDKWLHDENSVSIDDASCVVNYYTPKGFDPDILEQDSEKARETACSAFDFESFVCKGWYSNDSENTIGISVKRFFERTISLFNPAHLREIISSIENPQSTYQVNFHNSRGFSQLSHMNQELLKDVISQLSVYTPTGWFDNGNLSQVVGQVEKTQFRRLISSCVKSLDSHERIHVGQSVKEPSDIQRFIDIAHSVLSPMQTAAQKRDSGDNMEWDVGRSFGRAQCLGISSIIDVRATSHLLDRTRPALMVDVQEPIISDDRLLTEMYCSVVHMLPWRNNQNDKQKCLDTMTRINNAYDAIIRDIGDGNHESLIQEKAEAFFRSGFWHGFVEGMSEATASGSGPCIDGEIAESMLNSEIWTTPTETLSNADIAFAFYSMALSPSSNDNDNDNIIHVTDYIGTWSMYLEASIAADYVEYIDSERLVETVSPVFSAMYGYDMYTGQHPFHHKHKHTLGSFSMMKQKGEKEQKQWLKLREWDINAKQPWHRGHHHTLQDNLAEISRQDGDIAPSSSSSSSSKLYKSKWISRVKRWSSYSYPKRETTSWNNMLHLVSPERGNLEKEMDSSKWPVCTQLAASYMPSAVDNAFASMAITHKDIDMVSEVINRVIEQIIKSITASSVLSEDAKEKLVQKARMITIRVAVPWISRQNQHSTAESENTLAPPDHEEMGITGQSLWSDVSGIRRYALSNNLKAAFAPASSDRERRDRMIFKSGGLPHFGMPTSAVNAYYSPIENSINILSGIMGVPFHHKDYNMASRLATIGAVVGHEISHGFDSTGVHFDPLGSFALTSLSSSNNNGWLSESDMNAYENREQCFINKYDTVTRLGNQNNGENTLGENIADTMGTRAALDALAQWNREQPLRMDQEYPDKWELREFLQSYGQMWCNDMTKDQELHRIQTDVHSPGGTRINGAVSSLYFSTGADPLYIAYECRRDHHIGKTKREKQKSVPCTLW